MFHVVYLPWLLLSLIVAVYVVPAAFAPKCHGMS